MLHKLFIVLTVLLPLSELLAQDAEKGYLLSVGDRYFLEQDLHQNTHSEKSEFGGNITLDVGCQLIFDVISISPKGDYLMNCRYENLKLRFFSPRSELTINSSSNAFSTLKSNLSYLEEQEFTILLSPYGELLKIQDLDSIILRMSERVSDSSELEKIIIETIRDVFGESALISLCNTALQLYSESNNPNINLNSSLFFNASFIPVEKNIFYMPVADSKIRVQGIGVIKEFEDHLDREDLKIESKMKGTQTYDFLADNISGWIIEGVSKQKIFSISAIFGHPELPEGLSIQSMTETEFEFKGGKLASEKQK